MRGNESDSACIKDMVVMRSKKRVTRLVGCNLADLIESMATMRELDPTERKERGEGKEGRKGTERRKRRRTKDGGGGGRNFAFERTGENYGRELRCNIGPVGKRYGSQPGKHSWACPPGHNSFF